MNNNRFIKDFKSWLNNQKHIVEGNDNLVGEEVFPNISYKKLCETIDVVKGSTSNIAKNFINQGGIIQNIVENQALVVCRKGKFYIDVRDIKKS